MEKLPIRGKKTETYSSLMICLDFCYLKGSLGVFAAYKWWKVKVTNAKGLTSTWAASQKLFWFGFQKWKIDFVDFNLCRYFKSEQFVLHSSVCPSTAAVAAVCFYVFFHWTLRNLCSCNGSSYRNITVFNNNNNWICVEGFGVKHANHVSLALAFSMLS